MPRTRINEQHLKTIYRRQREPSWGSDYLPGMLATPKEAPSLSRAFILTPEKLSAREAHLLSTAERNATLLGLYHPHTCGLQEQRMLSPEPAVHPLWTMPDADRTQLPGLKGVIDVAERFGYLDVLPRLRVKDPEDAEASLVLIFPWLGDLLWAVRIAGEPVYCVNWTVKDKHEAFRRRLGASLRRSQSDESAAKVLARHEIEKAYYADAGIRTVRIADEDIDSHVSANLRQLFLHHRRPLGLTAEQRHEILDKFRTAQEADMAPAEVITFFAQKGRYSVDQCRSTLYQAIWRRELRVDLFSAILINRPLRPETRDVVDVYADWFRR